MKKERDSGMELLRIFAILAVIGVDALSHGHYYAVAKDLGGSVHSSALLLRVLFRVAVNVFIIITGYFMVHGRFDLKKTLDRCRSLWVRMLFYSLVITAIFLCLGSSYWYLNGKFIPLYKGVIRAFLPVTSQPWYFLTDYLILILLSPFINTVVQKITKNQYLFLLVVLTLFMSVWFTLMHVKPFTVAFDTYGYKEMVGGKNAFHFIYIYLLGGYVGLYGKKRERPQFAFLLGAAATVLVNYFLITRLPGSLNYADVAYHYANPFVVANAVFLLLFFKDLHFQSRLVNLLASTSMGVYAIAQFPYMRTFMWKVLDFRSFGVTGLFKGLLLLAAVILGVFFCFAALDLLREQLFRLCGKGFRRLHPKKEEPPAPPDLTGEPEAPEMIEEITTSVTTQ